jgi:hypothetical protein
MAVERNELKNFRFVPQTQLTKQLTCKHDQSVFINLSKFDVITCLLISLNASYVL